MVHLLACVVATADTVSRDEPPDLPDPPEARVVADAFPPPARAERAHADTFGVWLRQLPVKPPGSPVHTWEGDVVDMPAARVIDLPVEGERNLQCADTALRLRATWERSVGRSPAFHYTSGHLSSWSDWARGLRPRVRGTDVSWHLARAPDSSDLAFTQWLRDLYTYAGSYSLLLDTVPRAKAEPGDLLVTPGSPGHVVIVLDVAEYGTRSWVLVAQGFMPAMELHVVAGPDAGWFPVTGEVLPTEPIAMPWSSLRAWK